MLVKKIYRSNQDAYVAGVLGGFAEYFNQDSTLWRFCFIVCLIITGLMPGLVIYVVAWILIPKNPLIKFETKTEEPS